MNYKVMVCAAVGFLVAGFWAIYAAATLITPANGLAWTLAQLTQPIVLVGVHFNFGLRVWWVLLANAATYALVAFVIEVLLQRRRQPNRLTMAD